MPDLTGKTLGHYQITEKLGEGGMAIVYRATQPSIGREVAVKILPTNFLEDATFLERFNREVKVIAQLQHPRILPVYDFGEEGGMPYIVMAYMSGGSLEDLIRESKEGLPLDEVVRLVEQIAEALDFAHEKGIIHRDFKPQNVLLDDKKNAHLADFGIAKVAKATAELTGTGLVGTPTYMAPEMADEAIVSNKIDIYALGVTLYQMITGDVPYDSTNPMGILMAHLSYPIPDARKTRPDIPDDVQYVIETAMAKAPEMRYQTCKALVDDLKLAVKGELGKEPETTGKEDTAVPAPTVSDFLRERTESTQRITKDDLRARHKKEERKGTPGWVWALVGAIVVGVVGVGAFILLSGGGLPGMAVVPPQAAPPTDTPEPTDTPVVKVPTDTPAPTEAPVVEAPTDTPEPTATATATPTPTPESTPLGGGLGHIALVSDQDGDPEIFILDMDSGESIQVTDNDAEDAGPAWSPDGLWLAFDSLDSPQGRHIFVADDQGQDVSELTEGIRTDRYPLWSADGQTIVFFSKDGGRNYVRSITVNGSEQDLLQLPVSLALLDVAPDGRTVAGFGYTVDNLLEVQQVDMATGVRTPITQQVGLIEYLSYSPDRSKVVYTMRLATGRWQLFMADTDCPYIHDCNRVRLTDDVYNYYTPRFSPDGTLILVASDRFNNLDLFVLDLEGELVKQVTESEADEYDGAWQPAPVEP